jgi:preprotein translocase subunit SecG
VIGERRIGTLLIQSTLEDFSALSQEAFLSRLLATLAVFALGIMLALYLSWS